MTRFSYDDDDVVVVVGSGAGGGTVANELCQRGLKVVVLEAGPHLTGPDYHQDEWPAFQQMAWTDPRTTSGGWRIAEDFANLPAWIVKAVGGTTTHWAGACPRFKSHELTTRSTYGDIDGANLLDWPIALNELEPYYDQAEIKMGVTHRHGRPPLPANNNYKVLANGAAKLGYKMISTGPYATNAAPYDGRPATTQDGFNFQGDKQGSKWSTLVAELPKAEKTGNLDLRAECQAVQILHDGDGRKATGVLYVDRNGSLRRQQAAVVVVAGNSIETPRLLLLSGSAQHPDGLANSSGQVGRNYMRHTTGTVWGQFDKPVRMYRGETMAGVVADESHHDPDRGFVGGYYFQTIALGPAFLAKFMAPGKWGTAVTELLDQYAHTAGMWIVGEDIPSASNRVTLSEQTDAFGIPVAHVHYDDHANDIAMRAHGQRQGARIYEAVGATNTIETPPYPSTHNLGTSRMSQRPRDGVLDRHGRAHDVDNLFVADGSVMTTGGAANPTLTIVALAIRQAEFIADELTKEAA